MNELKIENELKNWRSITVSNERLPYGIQMQWGFYKNLIMIRTDKLFLFGICNRSSIEQ